MGMNENRFEYEGVHLVARESSADCDDCFFFRKECGYLRINNIIPECSWCMRKDKKNHVFIPKQNEIIDKLNKEIRND